MTLIMTSRPVIKLIGELVISYRCVVFILFFLSVLWYKDGNFFPRIQTKN